MNIISPDPSLCLWLRNGLEEGDSKLAVLGISLGQVSDDRALAICGEMILCPMSNLIMWKIYR